MGVFSRILFALGIPQPLSPAAIRVMKNLYALENEIKALPPGAEKGFVRSRCETLHKSLDDLRKYHHKKMPPDATVFGGPGTKEDDDGEP